MHYIPYSWKFFAGEKVHQAQTAFVLEIMHTLFIHVETEPQIVATLK